VGGRVCGEGCVGALWNKGRERKTAKKPNEISSAAREGQRGSGHKEGIVVARKKASELWSVAMNG